MSNLKDSLRRTMTLQAQQKLQAVQTAKYRKKQPERYEAAHAPAGGVSIGGKQFAGGQFIPGDVMAQATEQEKAQVEGKAPAGGGGGQPQGGGQQPSPQNATGASQGAGLKAMHQLQQSCCAQDATPPPPGEFHSPDVNEKHPNGITKAASVGVPGMAVPPPPADIPLLPMLNEAERAAETAFRDAYLADPDGLADALREAQRQGLVGDGPNVFSTDEAKWMSPDYLPDPANAIQNKLDDGETPLSDANLTAMSHYNTAVHQTANALAKRAFLRHLDSMDDPDFTGPRTVLVTAGGVAAGKGFAIKQSPAVKSIQENCGAIWDSAGEQNSTELAWVREECKKRGIKMYAAFIHADPVSTWENPKRGVFQRAKGKGRMVDAKLFADSYKLGADNFEAFAKDTANDKDVELFYFNNDTGGLPEQVDAMPPQAMNVDTRGIYTRALESLGNSDVPDRIKRGGSNGLRIWGGPDGGGPKEPDDRENSRLRGAMPPGGWDQTMLSQQQRPHPSDNVGRPKRTASDL